MKKHSHFAVGLAQLLLLASTCIAQSPDSANKGRFDDLLAHAQAGDAAAQVKLAEAYLGRAVQTGVAVQVNYEEAVRWYDAAAKQNNVEALFELGWGYEFGLFETKDGKKAAEYYRLAADLGNTKAKAQLTYLYTEGAEGLPRDFEEAARWANCPKPSTAAMNRCNQVTWDRLPQPAVALLRRLKCHVGSNYDFATEMRLASDSNSPYYEVCCREAAHGPCSAVLIGEVHGKWKSLSGQYGLFGTDSTCGGLMVLDAVHAGLHDLCLPNQCSIFKKNRCQPEILEMKGHGYEAALPDPTLAR